MVPTNSELTNVHTPIIGDIEPQSEKTKENHISSFDCNTCGKLFANQNGLNKHEKYDHLQANKLLKECDKCYKTFSCNKT